MGGSRGAAVGAQPPGEQQEARLGIPVSCTLSLCQDSCVSASYALPTTFLSAPPSPFPLLLGSVSPPPLRPVSSSSFPPPVSPPSPPPPAFFTLHHPAMHHSVPAIRLPFHLCLLLLRGGCDPRNISEGEEGVSRSRAEHDRLGRRSERGSLLQPGRGGGLVHLSGPRFKSCLFLTSAG